MPGLLGVDKGAGVKLLMLPPGYSEKIPDGYVALQPDTFGSYALFRSNLKSHSEADVAKSVAYGKRVKIYPLSQASNPPAAVFTDVKDVLFDSTIRYDESFFEGLNRIVQSEPWLDRDRAMIDQLKSIGIEKGKPFAPNAATKQALATGIREAQTLLEARYDAGLPPFFEGTHWTYPAPPELVQAAAADFAEPNAYPVDARGLAYSYAYIGIKRLGAGQFYLITIKDKDGESYDGAKTYRLTVPPNAPVEQYWSVTAYDRANPRAHQERRSRQPRVEQRRGAEERGRLGRSVFRSEGTGRQGVELDSDRSGPQVRTDVPALRADQGAFRQSVEAAGCRAGLIRDDRGCDNEKDQNRFGVDAGVFGASSRTNQPAITAGGRRSPPAVRPAEGATIGVKQ